MPAANPTPPAIDPARLLKTLSFALRHNPWAFGLDLAEDGFTPLDDLVASLRSRRPECRAGTTGELAAAVRDSDPERFEVRDERIRARYGHSFPVHQFGPTGIPPETLFHGTADGTTLAICHDGLRPMGRYYVHLTSDLDYAAGVGTAKGDGRVLLVRARSAHDAGVLFYPANAHVWLVAGVPPEYLTDISPGRPAHRSGVPSPGRVW